MKRKVEEKKEQNQRKIPKVEGEEQVQKTLYITLVFLQLNYVFKPVDQYVKHVEVAETINHDTRKI